MKKVIVQDSDSDLLETLKIILEEAYYEVLTVLHYEDVLPQIITFKPRLVLLDFKLKGDQCKGLCHQIKEIYPTLPILALSCNHNIKEQYFKAGFDDYIAKPFDIEYLMQVLEKYSD